MDNVLCAPSRGLIDDAALCAIKDRLPDYLNRKGFLPEFDATRTRHVATCPLCRRERKLQLDRKGVWLAKCWSAGCTISGGGAVDLIGLVALLEGLDAKRDFRRVAEIAAHEVGVTIAESTGPRMARADRAAIEARRRERDEGRQREKELEAADREAKRATWPKFVESPERGVRNLARLRGIPWEGVRAAHEWGVLRFVGWKGHPCWVLRDHLGLAAEARRMDGERFLGEDGPKAMALPGSAKKHALLGEHLLGGQFAPDPILLTEGGPDFLAACWLAWAAMDIPGAPAWTPSGVLGANADFTEDQLDRLTERTVRIFVHDDDAGRAAANRWADSLESVGCAVELIHVGQLGQTQPDGKPVADLNDALRAANDPEAFARLATAPF